MGKILIEKYLRAVFGFFQRQSGCFSTLLQRRIQSGNGLFDVCTQ
jgi:hypothetical protein